MNSDKIPKHIAIIMDGNGRWASGKDKPRNEGHRAGVNNAKEIVRRAASTEGVEILSLYTFSSENRRRPVSEVMALTRLLTESLRDGVDELHENDICLKFIGDLSFFDKTLRETMRNSEDKTKQCKRLQLQIAVNYGGRWDIIEAFRKITADGGKLPDDDEVLQELIARHLASPELDLLIRTGDEQRISNFFLWQSAYAEFYFSPSLWPEFSAEEFDSILAWYARRQRRFGLTSSQIEAAENA